MRSFRLAVSLVAIAALSTACISEPTATSISNAELAGTYVLRAVNGAALPAVVQSAIGSQPKIELLSDSLLVRADGSWSGVQSIRTTTGTTAEIQTIASSGTYTVSGALVTFKDTTDGTVFAASVSGNAFLFTDGVSSYLYTR